MRTGLTWFALLGALSCRPPSSAAPPLEREKEAQAVESDPAAEPPSPERPVAEVDDWSLATHRKIVLRPQSLVLSLPQGNNWKAQPRRGTWSGLLHEGSASEIWVRHAAARRTVTIEECEREARLSWELIREPSEAAVERALKAPSGYGGRLRVILSPGGGGRVEAFSVGVSRCLAVVFITGEEPGFPERLRVAVNEVIENLRVPTVGERTVVPRLDP